MHTNQTVTISLFVALLCVAPGTAYASVAAASASEPVETLGLTVVGRYVAVQGALVNSGNSLGPDAKQGLDGAADILAAPQRAQIAALDFTKEARPNGASGQSPMAADDRILVGSLRSDLQLRVAESQSPRV